MCKKWNPLIASPITVTSREAVLWLSACACGAVACLMTGMVVGMLISPRKNVAIGSHNGGNVVDKRSLSSDPAPEAESEEIPF